MKRYFSNQDLQEVFEYLTKSGGLSLVRVKGRNTGEVSSHVSQIIRYPVNADISFRSHVWSDQTQRPFFSNHIL
jgi:hypothetical protein